MTPHVHDSELDSKLLSYWLDELDEAQASEVEEHLFACEGCAARLRELLDLRNAVRAALRDSRFAAVVTPAFVRRLQAAGLRLREYHLLPGGSVPCTFAPTDDFVVSHLHAPLAGVRQVDLVYDDGHSQHRAPHLPFDAAADEVTVIPPVAMLRNLGTATHRMRLFAVTPSSERLLGEYTFNHEPWSPT